MEQVKIYQLDVTKFEDPQCFQKHYAMLSKGRQKKIDAYRVDNAKRLSLGAGVLLERGLREYNICERDVKLKQERMESPIWKNIRRFILIYHIPEIWFLQCFQTGK